MNAVQHAQSNQIVELMQQPAEHRDANWLKEAVQQAVLLELATLPPYLCGTWSINGGGNQVRKILREIVFDEMSHLGIACNLLTTIDGTPRLADEMLVPAYPGPLPGGVRPELKVFLSGLTEESVRMYASIEEPDAPVTQAAAAEFASIGAFYTAILDAFRASPQLISGHRQVERDMTHHGAGNSLEALNTFDDVERAIAVIKEQGEGTSAGPENPYPGVPGEPAHYYAFQEILHRRKLKKTQGPDQRPKWEFEGDPVPWPTDILPMGVVPQGGWPRPDDLNPEVTGLLDEFNRAYSDLLVSLERVWKQGNPQLLDDAESQMFMLQAPARDLMQYPLPYGGGRYGPEFRYVAP